MNRKNIHTLCMLLVLAATAAFTLGGCTEGNNPPTSTTKTVNANNATNDNEQPSRLHTVQDKVSVQHR